MDEEREREDEGLAHASQDGTVEDGQGARHP